MASSFTEAILKVRASFSIVASDLRELLFLKLELVWVASASFLLFTLLFVGAFRVADRAISFCWALIAVIAAKVAVRLSQLFLVASLL